MNGAIEILRILAIALAAATGLASTAWAGGVKVPNPVPFGAEADVREAVRNECQLGEKVASFIAQFGDDIELVSGHPGKNGRVLDVKISHVFAPGGGAFSGPKWMELEGTLKQDGKRVASFRAKRFTTGGAFAGFKGTCSIIGRCTKALGKDVAEWLKNPTDNALLGDAQ
jgi:hypothetical protein